MKLSIFIQNLKELKDKHGDLYVNVFDPESFEDSELETVPAHITLGADSNGKVNAITICDNETALSFV